MRTIARVILLSVASTAGCHVAATAEGYRWSVKAPATVMHQPHSRLTFTVEARATDGQLVAEVPFVWFVHWVGVNGVEHQGWSSREHSILVKGDSGTATLRILARGPYGLVEVARHEFKVEEGPAPSP
jgi:hypothetical protein